MIRNKMFSVVLGMLVFVFSTQAFAAQKKIVCQDIPGQSMGAFALTLDNTHIQPNSGYFTIINASWSFAYSSANRMNCSDSMISINGQESFKCAGYVNGQGLIEVKINLDGGEGSAQIHNIEDNFYDDMTEGMILPCHLE